MAGRKLCCFRISTWAMIVSWISIILSVTYIIFLILSLLGLVGGTHNMRQLVRDTPDKYPEYYKLLEYTYEYLVFYLFLLVAYNMIGIPLNIVLLRGALMRNERKLLVWLYYTLCNVVIMFPYLMWRFISPDAIPNSVIRLTVNYAYVCFSFWCVFGLLHEIRNEKKAENHNRFSFGPSAVLMMPGAEDSAPGADNGPPERLETTEVAPPSPFADYNLT